MKLKEYPFQKFGFKACDGNFGLEFETEVPNLASYPTGFLNPNSSNPVAHIAGLGDVGYYDLWGKAWKGVIDNSLRNFGVEYILRKPHSFEGTLRAIDEFSQYTKDIPFIKDAPGTSVHVHINMQNEEIITLFTYICTWIFLENILTEFSGEARRSNLFALPTRVATQSLETYKSIVNNFLNRKQAFSASETHNKYSALNVAPLNKLGSIEVRTMRGTVDNTVLKQWVTILNDILVYSRENKPSDLLRLYNREGCAGMLNTILSDTSFLANIDNVEARVEGQLLNVYSFVQTADWDDVRDFTYEKPKADAFAILDDPIGNPHTITQAQFDAALQAAQANFAAMNTPMPAPTAAYQLEDYFDEDTFSEDDDDE